MRPISLVLLLLAVFGVSAAEPAPFVWIEAESPSESTPRVKPAETGHADWLSGGKWLFVNVELKDFAKQLPNGAASFKYPFATKVDGNYEVWHRAGMEYVRSPFEWRIDEGKWTLIDSRDPKFQTIDLMELATWNEVGWQQLGAQQLTSGDHKLEIRVPIPKDGKGQPMRLLFASDCFCLSAGPFHPHSKLKPGESNRDATDEKAAKQVFELPAPAQTRSGPRLRIKGLWEVCRHDEDPGAGGRADDRYAGGVTLEGDCRSGRQEQDAGTAVRPPALVRCKVKVPAEHAGKSFVLTFPQNSLNTTVFVNGGHAGSTRIRSFTSTST